MIQRNGCVIIRMLDNVQRTTLEPIIGEYVKANSTVYTDEYNIYNWLSSTYVHKRVNHGKGEYARDDEGDGKHEVHVNTMKGFWSLLRPCLRPHCGISQERLPYYLGFFEYLHNIIKRGQVALSALIGLLVAT